MDTSKPSDTTPPAAARGPVDDEDLPPIIERVPRQGPAHHVGALLPLLLGLLWVYFAYSSFPLGDLREPGPALWPVIVGIFTALISLNLWLTERDDTEYEPFTSRSKLVPLGAIATAIFIVIYTYVGFLVAGFLLMAFWVRFLGRETWRLSLVVAAATSLLGYLIFGELLGVPLPGPF
ncbi:tripartite tricarboxylate transporter TctB family protein [Blastococcus haudaquaticus]|uniref:Tripartite tricarboxylate transporter TctB family protein n=1 Tax=Blastococcus haudaquaticus TaxID=1938745 RepID=A0A286GUY9_9ACTN|nr:tripartite tricarboxylate transporter TctB family protein [Blastococcus haudaquaticus]SOD98996.1 Tripartite tricarboxylate transporter TctB family protein [Blastococcus haudaquaticus]